MNSLRIGTALSVCLCALFSPQSVRAESLADATLRKVYADGAAAVRDAIKTRHLMEARLDEKFAIKSNLTLIVGDAAPKGVTNVLDKTGAIDDVMRSSSTMTIGDYRYAIVNIKLSDDKKYAYVQDTSTSTGTMAGSDPAGHSLTANYTASQGCLDLLTLALEKIVYLKSECNTKLTITK